LCSAVTSNIRYGSTAVALRYQVFSAEPATFFTSFGVASTRSTSGASLFLTSSGGSQALVTTSAAAARAPSRMCRIMGLWLLIGQKVSSNWPVIFRKLGYLKPSILKLKSLPDATSGSKPLYLVHVFRLRPITANFMPFTTLSSFTAWIMLGLNVYAADSSRSFTYEPSSTNGALATRPLYIT